MQKIMFNDKCGLTQAVLEGRKTMTRRIEPCIKYLSFSYGLQGMSKRVLIRPNGDVMHYCENSDTFAIRGRTHYKVGEVVAIAQSYNDIYEELKRTHGSSSIITREFFHKYIQGGRIPVTNKMFVKADLMPHQIRITDIKVERLQDISDEDCVKEGVYTQDIWSDIDYCFENICFGNAQEAFRYMLSNCCKPKTLWEDNPWVFAYSYELVK